MCLFYAVIVYLHSVNCDNRVLIPTREDPLDPWKLKHFFALNVYSGNCGKVVPYTIEQFYIFGYMIYIQSGCFWYNDPMGAQVHLPSQAECLWKSSSTKYRSVCKLHIKFTLAHSIKKIFVLKTSLNLALGYLLLSNVYNKVLYILSSPEDREEVVACLNIVFEFLLPYPILSIATVDACHRHMRPMSESL